LNAVVAAATAVNGSINLPYFLTVCPLSVVFSFV
jgi:hypothetical protein